MLFKEPRRSAVDLSGQNNDVLDGRPHCYFSQSIHERPTQYIVVERCTRCRFCDFSDESVAHSDLEAKIFEVINCLFTRLEAKLAEKHSGRKALSGKKFALLVRRQGKLVRTINQHVKTVQGFAKQIGRCLKGEETHREKREVSSHGVENGEPAAEKAERPSCEMQIASSNKPANGVMAKERPERKAADDELNLLLSQTQRERSEASSKHSGAEIEPGKSVLSLLAASFDPSTGEAVLKDPVKTTDFLRQADFSEPIDAAAAENDVANPRDRLLAAVDEVKSKNAALADATTEQKALLNAESKAKEEARSRKSKSAADLVKERQRREAEVLLKELRESDDWWRKVT
eukprot:TRINITY_DN7912_c0_g1_i1.p1 TRINITY_DN7912_c0_g1~~TRINITY_DN7912_c0_g1_i1.p1  ORF type:complete len:346 (-),score=55.27 TRINITY_DN7912_c0_g1_i1:281-1318(-)